MALLLRLTDRYPRRLGWAIGLALTALANYGIWWATAPMTATAPPRCIGFPIVFWRQGGQLDALDFRTNAFVVDVAWALGVSLFLALYLARRAYLRRARAAGHLATLDPHAPIGLHGETR